MANDHGLPSVPRGLDRELSRFLQSMLTVVSRLSGLVRGSEQARAVRVADGATGSGSSAIADGGVTAAKLASAAVTEEKIATGAVTEKKIGKGAVTKDAIADGAVVAAMADGTLPGAKLADGTVTAEKLATGAVTSSILAFGAVGGEELADMAVGAEHIRDGAVPLAKLAADARTSVVFGSAATQDGETVKIPAVWYGMPVVVPVAVMAESTAISGVKFGALDMREAQDSAGAGTGEWSFRAAGAFTWAAMGYARMFLTANGGNNG